MIQSIAPFNYQGELSAPYSKSYLQRAIAIAFLSKTKVEIHGYTPSNDAKVALRAVEEMGGSFSIEDNKTTILPAQSLKESVSLNFGEAGLSTRMFSPISTALFDQVTINGEGSILVRPMDMVIEALDQLGVDVSSQNGLLPLKTKGKLQGNEITIDGSESSQLLTGLLIALPLLSEDSIINVLQLKSKPYVQMTLDILDHFGVEVVNEDFKRFTIKGNQIPRADTYKVEGDWSGASFHVVGASISGELKLKNLNPNSAQADSAILEAIKRAGAKYSWNEGDLHIEKDKLNAFEFDATECPDLFPPVAALAACCNGISRIKGTNRLTHKESNRALTIQEEFAKLGVQVDLEEDIMIIHGGGEIKGGKVDSRNDHRIAMATAILATQTTSPIEIENSSAINKSYPGFYEDLSKL
ncbi:MAG: 3-phosphoshikimate 1-carboxyvinyltransferase [Crocinitomicaceae bacterium]|nr:3-phosphoshikimate 1-carboxyvinyltransferase [Crocinitomicaceae bacterium]